MEETCGDTQRKPAAKLRGNPRRKSICTAEVNLHGGSEFTQNSDQRTSPLHFLSEMVDRNDSTNERAILESLFYKGYEYNEIINLLKTQHSMRMSMRTLKRRLKFYNLSRNGVEFDPGCLRNMVVEILDGPGISRGYRSISHTLQRKGVRVPRSVVEKMVRELNPNGVEERKAYKSGGGGLPIFRG